mmetsp:Transcript_22659/g.47297  ORF Transcript_22659/g.47297 Transcript_22659/m.47297 type:complete len:313 (-) Transcript_22659:56-994(-)
MLKYCYWDRDRKVATYAAPHAPMLPIHSMYLNTILPICSKEYLPRNQDEHLHLLLGEEVSVLLERSSREGILLPEIRLQVSVGVTEGVKQRLDEVTHGTGVTTGGGVAILDTGHAQKTLTGGRGNKSGTAGSGNETNTDRTALARHLSGDRVGHATLTSPESTTDGCHVELGREDGTTDSGGDLRGALDTKANVSRGISDSNEGLETSALTSGTLLLHGHDLHDLVLKLVLQEVVDDLGLLHGDGEEEDLLDGADLALLYETSEFGDRSPDVLVTVSASSATAASSAASTVSASTSTSAFSASKTSSFVRHD